MIKRFALRAGPLLFGIWVIILVTSITGINLVPAASHHSGAASTSSLTLVLLSSTDGQAHYGQQITFKVSTSATTEPHVNLSCTQNGAVVYQTVTGYYAGYPWPWTQTMTLSSPAWTGGAGACTAELYYFKGSRTMSLATLTFQVLA